MYPVTSEEREELATVVVDHLHEIPLYNIEAKKILIRKLVVRIQSNVINDTLKRLKSQGGKLSEY